MDGEMNATGKMKVGYFTQYQVEELDADDTPLEHMTRIMRGASPAAVRAQLGRFGFSGDKAVGKAPEDKKAKKDKAKPIDRDADKARRKAIRDAEAEIAKLTTERNALDRAMFDPKTAEPRFAKLAMGDLMKRRADAQDRIDALEAQWLEATEALEAAISVRRPSGRRGPHAIPSRLSISTRSYRPGRSSSTSRVIGTAAQRGSAGHDSTSVVSSAIRDSTIRARTPCRMSNGATRSIDRKRRSSIASNSDTL
ncbi:hypothetical protein WR25_16009 [Diploscapter pachys]|uniref:Uncharacterized protein n=1 Tax=Diploscapter pachys TaxID=2018661 RepID=A0A2A2K7H8_9BILA|nr:hypothetical protein WR25_16009 [Diploscapter pachys]